MGRDKINANFECINEVLGDLQLASSTGATMLTQGTNIVLGLTYSSTTPIYDVSTSLSPTFSTLSANSISATTLYSGSTNLNDLLNDIASLSNGGNNYGTQVNVSAIGPDNYIGTGTPTITGYSNSTIYITQFDSTNSTTAVTVNIDSNGVLDIVKGTENGLEPLEIGEIQTGVNYFLTYDGTQLQFFSSSPEGTPGTYTNLNPTTTTIGGILAGTSFSGISWQEIFDIMFYPTLVPNFSAFIMRATPTTASTQSQTLEVGDSVSGGTRVFTWATTNSSFVQSNSVKIYNSSTLISTPTSGITNDSVETITGLTNVQKVTPTSHTWKIYATRTNSSIFYKTFVVYWYWRRMYGVSTATTITTSNEVNAFSGSSALTSTISGTYSFTGAGYKYFFVPSTFTSPSLFKDNSTQLAVAMADVTDEPFFSASSGSYSYGTTSVINQFGISQTYRIYRTRNYLNGNITIIVT